MHDFLKSIAMNNGQLVYALRSVADTYGVADPRSASLCSLLRQSADALERCDAASDQAIPRTVPDASADLVLDDDWIPMAGRPCPSCGGE